MLPTRKTTRLQGYDYAQEGMYYVTICASGRECRFVGATLVVAREPTPLNAAGIMVENIWLSIPKLFPNVSLDEYVVMPNHFHGIVVIGDGECENEYRRATTRVAPTPTLGRIIGAFKSITTHRYIVNVKNGTWPPFTTRLWQRNYYEHIIRNDDDLERIRYYIRHNPENWHDDELA